MALIPDQRSASGFGFVPLSSPQQPTLSIKLFLAPQSKSLYLPCNHILLYFETQLSLEPSSSIPFHSDHVRGKLTELRKLGCVSIHILVRLLQFYDFLFQFLLNGGREESGEEFFSLASSTCHHVLATLVSWILTAFTQLSGDMHATSKRFSISIIYYSITSGILTLEKVKY